MRFGCKVDSCFVFDVFGGFVLELQIKVGSLSESGMPSVGFEFRKSAAHD